MVVLYTNSSLHQLTNSTGETCRKIDSTIHTTWWYWAVHSAISTRTSIYTAWFILCPRLIHRSWSVGKGTSWFITWWECGRTRINVIVWGEVFPCCTIASLEYMRCCIVPYLSFSSSATCYSWISDLDITRNFELRCWICYTDTDIPRKTSHESGSIYQITDIELIGSCYISKICIRPDGNIIGSCNKIWSCIISNSCIVTSIGYIQCKTS